MRIGALKRKEIWIVFLPIVLGIISFFTVIGPRALSPTNIAWIREGDPATHYLGWLFFRNSDWSFPIGLNPRYGLEISNSVVYSDSIPLLAIIFKPFSVLLPQTFQYFGLWLLTCFVLQAWFSWKLIGLISENTVIRLLGAGLLVFAPPMMMRMNAHLSLVGHFLIVAALYFVLRPRLERRLLTWGLLLAVSALVHPYLLAMATLLWLVDLIGRSTLLERSMASRAGEFLTLTMTIAFLCWQAGYFTVGSGVAERGYGHYRMNLLSVFDASVFDTYEWSYILKSIANASGDYEGFNYLGLGVLILVFWSLPCLVNGRIDLGAQLRRRKTLFVALVGVTLFALSNNTGIGIYNVEILLPEALISVANIFRSSGRMFWPAFYAIVFTIIFVIVRGFNKRTTIFLLSLALVFQVADTSAGWKRIRQIYMVKRSAEWESEFHDPFWVDAGHRYQKVRWVFPKNISPHWYSIASYAGRYGMATDAVYLARVGKQATATAHDMALHALQTGKYEPDALYILDEHAVRQAIVSLNPRDDLLARIDGFNVLAPGWISCDECRQPPKRMARFDIIPAEQYSGPKNSDRQLR